MRVALTPKVDETYKLKADFGSGPGALSAGVTAKVVGIYEPGTPGLGASAEDTVSAELTDADGALRILALPVSQWQELFSKVSK
ncbi:hypothetical protein AB0G15_05340 [Streptosporangium sp. NPDC023825]|uniref:hypothetical protein n=1 Tax=Streptosporangium sp. NPDC023825 TaxID=3154909 RepID=UPI00344802F2